MTEFQWRRCECGDMFKVNTLTESQVLACPRCRMAAVEEGTTEWPVQRNRRRRDEELRALGIGC